MDNIDFHCLDYNERKSFFLDRRSITAIDLIQKDPIKRLEELCKKGLYDYWFRTNTFKNGIMATCLLYYDCGNGGQRVKIYKVAQFIYSTDELEAERIICDLLLRNIGLDYK